MRRTVPLALAAALLASSCGGRQPAPAAWKRLPNGLRFCVYPVRGATNVAVAAYFDVGSEHDPVGKSGLAHLTEHVYVSSAAGETRARTADEWLAAHPDGCDAGTSERWTRFLAVVTPEAAERGIADAAWRMGDLQIEDSDLSRERSSVLQQIAEEEHDAVAVERARRAAMDLARPLPNGGHGVGAKGEVERLTLDDVRERARRFYKPVNARLIVAGDVDSAATAAMIERRFAGIAPGEPIGAPEPPLPTRAGTVELQDDPSLPKDAPRERAICVVYRTERSTAADAAALGRFLECTSHRRRGYFVRISIGQDAVAIMCSRKSPLVEDFVASIEADVADFASKPPTPDEIESARRLAGVTEDERSAPPAERAARAVVRIGTAEVGTIDEEAQERAYEALTKVDVARYAAKWLTPANRVVVVAWGRPDPGDPNVVLPRDERGPAPVAEVRVAMIWDETTRTIHRKIGDHEYADDADLQKAIADAHDAWVKQGKPDARVTIDADGRIPWPDVIKVVNIAKRLGLKIEFAMGAPPKSPVPK